MQEEARLLYVGLTRARDYLVFPTAHRPTSWLNRVWHEGREDYPTLDQHSNDSPWEWDGAFLDIKTTSFPYPRDFPYQEVDETAIQYQTTRAQRRPHVPYFIDLTTGDSGITANGKIVQAWPYAKGVECQEEEDTYVLAKAIKAFYTADHITYPLEERQLIAQQLIDRFDLRASNLTEEHLIRNSDAWWPFLEKQFGYNQGTHRKYPLTHHHGGRCFETIADLILETATGLVLVQYSGFAGEGRSRQAKAIELAPWLYLTKTALQQTFNQTHIRTFVHFVMTATLIELEVSGDGS